MTPCSLSDYLLYPAENKVALTFDDAFESVYHNAYPLLKEKGFTFTVFPSTGYIGKYNRWEVNLGGRQFHHMDWPQLQDMEGCEIGSHTVSHRCLTSVNSAELKRELADSKKTIEDCTGKEVKFLSLPFGKSNRKVLDCAQEIGYQAVFSLNPQDGEQNYLKGRFAVYFVDNRWSMLNKISRGNCRRCEIAKLKFINFFSGGTVLAQKIFGLHNTPEN